MLKKPSSSLFPKFSLLQQLKLRAPLICDGDLSTTSLHLGFSAHDACFLASLHDWNHVRQLHQEYAKSGAEVLRTNTEGAHCFALEELGIAGREEALNNSAMALLQEAIGRKHLAVGAISSVRKMVEGSVLKKDIEFAYGQQAVYLSDTGACFLVLNGFHNHQDLQSAIRAIHRSSQKEVLAYLAPDKNEKPQQILDYLKNYLETERVFVGLELCCDDSRFEDLLMQAVEEVGIIGCMIGELENLAYGEVSQSFQEAVNCALKTEVSIIAGGNQTTPAHIQMISATMVAS